MKKIFGMDSSMMLAMVLLIAGSWLIAARTAQASDVVVYKSPTCECCSAWVRHLQQNGYTVEVQDRNDLPAIKSKLGVPGHLQSCHTAMVEGYVIEGHVPAADIQRLLREKPAISGLTAPGMPMGSPGMEGPRQDPYDVLTFQTDGRTPVFARH